LTSFELGFGPMSYEIVEALAQWTIDRDHPLMLIASRSQVDSALVGGGYVMDTAELGRLTRKLNAPKLKLCRDHCGPYLSKLDQGLSMDDAVTRCKVTIESDLKAGFDLIHIDASQCGGQEREVALELIQFTKLHPVAETRTIEFEYGSEDNVGIAVSLERFERDLRFVLDYIDPTFVVGQTGSLVRQARQAGTFDVEHARKLVEMANRFGTQLKEHNSDYLTPEEIDLRRQAGVHALNIAPQLGVVQTVTTAMAARALNLYDEWDDFRDVILAGGNWQKWGASLIQDQIACAGHYHFGSEQYQALMAKLAEHCDIGAAIKTAIWDVVDRYR
jgi:hypothetical protein